jgi:hypothetical protein
MFLDLLEDIDVYDRATVNTDKYFRIQNFLKLTNTRRTYELVVLVVSMVIIT